MLNFLIMLTVSLSANAFDHKHLTFDKVLKTFVVKKGPQSGVKYTELKAEPGDLNSYVSSIEAVTKNDYTSFSDPEKIAFLINAYNALTIKLILDNYPVEGIKKTVGFLKSPWKKEFFSLFGQPSFLDHIEHDILRKDFREPRVHFALVCASVSCPALRGEAYVPDRLGSQLDEQAKNFLRDPERNKVDQEGGVIFLSSIFKWFKEDFEKASGSVSNFVSPLLTDNKEFVEKLKTFKLKYNDYDWTLNDAKKL